jgi:hypothetical protein
LGPSLEVQRGAAQPSLLSGGGENASAGNGILSVLDSQGAKTSSPVAAKSSFTRNVVASGVFLLAGVAAWQVFTSLSTDSSGQKNTVPALASLHEDAAKPAPAMNAVAVSASPAVTAPPEPSPVQSAQIVEEKTTVPPVKHEPAAQLAAAKPASAHGDEEVVKNPHSVLSKALESGTEPEKATESKSKPVQAVSEVKKPEAKNAESKKADSKKTAIAKSNVSDKTDAAKNDSSRKGGDSDVELLEALVAHSSGQPVPKDEKKTVANNAKKPKTSSKAAPEAVAAKTPEKNTDVVERHPGDSTESLLKRCKQLGFLEGELCRWRMCTGRWNSDPACGGKADDIAAQ